MSERRPIVITVDHRYVLSNGNEVALTKAHETAEVVEFKTKPAAVRRSFGVTLNQGNYESARIDVSVEVPCYLEDLALADEYARNFCEERLRAEVLMLKAGDDKKKTPF